MVVDEDPGEVGAGLMHDTVSPEAQLDNFLIRDVKGQVPEGVFWAFHGLLVSSTRQKDSEEYEQVMRNAYLVAGYLLGLSLGAQK